ncbi:MAG: CHAT domain-containing protein [Betaproteobacteria bacterium]
MAASPGTRRIAVVLATAVVLASLAAAGARLWRAKRGARPAPQAAALDLDQARRLLARSDYKSALPILERALQDARRRGDEQAQAEALRGLGIARWGQGNYTGALTIDREALALARRRGVVADECVALNGLGLSSYNLGRYADALDFYRQALAVDARAPSPKFEGLVYANIGLVERYQGRLDEALADFERSLTLRQRAGDAAGVAQTLNHLGILSRARGQLQQAIAYYERALAERRRLGDRQGEAQTLNNLANVYLDLDERDRALDAYGQSLHIAEQIGYTMQVALANANIGDVLNQMGRPREAIGRYTVALDMYRQLNYRTQIAFVTRETGALLAEMGDLKKARALLEESLQVARELGEPGAQALALDELGHLEEKEGRRDAAMTRFDEGLTLTRSSPMPDVAYHLYTDRGAALRRAGRIEAALKDLRAAVALVTDMRARLTTDLGKIGFLDVRADAFEQLVEALLASNRPGEALEAAERGRARAMADLLGSRSASVKAGSLEAMRSLERAAALARASQPAAVPAADAAHDTDTLDSALADLRTRDRELASLVTVDSPRISEIRAIAARLQSTLVEYFVTPEHVWAWVVERSGRVHVARIPIEPGRLEQEGGDIRRLLESRSTAHGPPPASEASLLRALDRQLVEPLEAWLPRSADEPLVIVAPGVLSTLPFAALQGRDGRPLVERHTLAFAPAISVFRYTQAKKSAVVPGDWTALAVADPALPPNSGLTALPAARDEAAAVRRVFRGARVLEGAAASEAVVKRDASSYELVDLAAHGLVWPDRPLASSIVLTPGGGDDGYLRVDEVFGLNLHASLVVLSGCSTGSGRVTGDGVLGFARAFMYAGTPDVVVTGWDVSDRGAAALMSDFYAAIADQGSPARALRRAQLLARARNPDPASWAAFVVVGEP